MKECTTNLVIYQYKRGGRMLKKGDIVIIGVVALAAAAAFLLLRFGKPAGEAVSVSQNNAVIYTGPLTKDKTISLAGNTVEIKDGRVKMAAADCKNQICVHHTSIHKKGESITCLPNKVFVEIE